LAGETLGEVIRRLGRSGALQGDLGQTDAQLVERFARRRDEPAFAALVVRHGPMVLGVCRRLLPDAQDAEDAFQAAFLVLARRAAAIQRRTLLAAWLHGVAWRVALRLRGRLAQRRERERAGVDLDALPADDAAWSDVRCVVHEEVQRLPDVYRSAIILCCLEGMTNEEAARVLRRPVGTVKSRLTRARDLLRSRLTRRGVALSMAALGAALAANTATASAPLTSAVVRAALPFAAGGAVAGGGVSARAVALSQGVLRTMVLKKVTIAATLVLVVALVGGVGGLAYRSWAAAPGDAPKAVAPPADKPGPADKPMDDREAIQGVWRVAAVETEGVERDDDVARDMKKQTWTIRSDKLIVHIEAPGPARDTKFTYSLDAAQTPKTVDLTSDQSADGSPFKNLHGVYAVDGDVLRFCYSMTGAEMEYWNDLLGKRREGIREINVLLPAGPRPKDIATKPGGKTTLLTLKRVKPDPDKPKDVEKALLGSWRLIAAEKDAKDATDDEETRRFKEPTWLFTAEGLVFHRDGQADATELIGLRTSKSPKELDFPAPPEPRDEPGKDTMLWAVFSLEGDVLKICVPTNSNRPTVLAAKQGDKTLLLALKRDPLEGVVKEIDDRSILLAGGDRFTLDDRTEYLAETGLDATPAKRTDVTVGKRVCITWTLKAGKPAAVAVYIRKFD
jgi:RNA polymerase sigma factor (sigma-70 family)